MTDLTEQEVCIGSLEQQKVYLNWSDVKDICTNEVSEAYEQTKRENTKLKEELKDYEYQHKQDGICYDDIFCKLELARKENRQLKELLKECRQWFDWYHIDTGTGKEYIESWYKKGREIHQKINQALGEDK